MPSTRPGRDQAGDRQVEDHAVAREALAESEPGHETSRHGEHGHEQRQTSERAKPPLTSPVRA